MTKPVALICTVIAVAAATGIASAQPTVRATPGYMLAAVDGASADSAAYERRLRTAARRCRERPIRVADMVTRSREILKADGVRSTNWGLMTAIINEIPPSMAGQIRCEEVLATYIVLLTQ